MDNVIDFLSKIKPYDISEIYKIGNRHPFQVLLPCLREQISHGNLEKFKINGWVGEGGHELEEFYNLKKYFKKLDNFYRYGFSFDDDIFFFKYLFVYVGNDCRCYIINKFKYEDETHFKYINLDNFYKSNEELSLLEQWKRKVVFRQKFLKIKLLFYYHLFIIILTCSIIYFKWKI